MYLHANASPPLDGTPSSPSRLSFLLRPDKEFGPSRLEDIINEADFVSECLAASSEVAPLLLFAQASPLFVAQDEGEKKGFPLVFV